MAEEDPFDDQEADVEGGDEAPDVAADTNDPTGDADAEAAEVEAPEVAEDADEDEGDLADEFKIPCSMPGTEHVTFITGDDRITPIRMSKYEYCRIVGTRAQQISTGSEAFCDCGPYATPREVAESELRAKKCPFKVVRPYGNVAEVWSANEMILPSGGSMAPSPASGEAKVPSSKEVSAPLSK
jgi:DNA-directed RNA polymerase subunit K/omega